MIKKKFYIVFDTEACRIATNIRENGISYLSYYNSKTEQINGLFENDVKKFQTILEECDFVVGYNIFGYDYPVLESYFKIDLTRIFSVDIFKLIVDQHKLYLKLDNLGTTTLDLPKIASGLDAVRFYNEGKLDKLKEYCDTDVEITTKIFHFLLDNGYLLYKDGLGNKKKISLELPKFLSQAELDNPFESKNNSLF